jgi:hypothetical protein
LGWWVAESFPTPSASLGEHGGLVTPMKAREGGTLIEAVSARRFPSPIARDWKSTSKAKTATNARTLSEMALEINAEAAAANEGAPLNPDWVEWLMGFPIGWTAIPAGE